MTHLTRKFFLYSRWGDLLPLGRLLQAAGADVLLYVTQDRAEHVGLGLIPKTENPNPPKGFVVIFDDTGFGEEGQDLRARGFSVIGGNPLDQALGRSRRDGIRLMREHNIAVPETKDFRTVVMAMRFLEEEGGAWFVKVDGDLGNASTVDGRAEDILRYLSWLDGQVPRPRGIELQKSVDGDEISIEGWFDGQKFIEPFNVTVEEKKFQTGDHGPRTGCESCVVFLLNNAQLPQQTLLKMTETLRQHHYVGPLDLNTVVTEQGPVGLEWTARLGFDSSHALFHLMAQTRVPLPEQLEAFAHGDLAEWYLQPTPALTLRFTVPPYPNEDDAKTAAKMRGFPLDSKILDLDITDVQMGKDGPEMAGRDGLLGVVTVLGPVASGRTRALATLENLNVPGLQYRVDPTHRYEATVANLTKKELL